LYVQKTGLNGKIAWQKRMCSRAINVRAFSYRIFLSGGKACQPWLLELKKKKFKKGFVEKRISLSLRSNPVRMGRIP
jgi:hypothetical protein